MSESDGSGLNFSGGLTMNAGLLNLSVNRRWQRYLTVVVGCLGSVLFAEEAKVEVKPPASQEIWVPSADLETVLKKHPKAVLLDRESYQRLIADAGKVRETEEDPPVEAVLEGVKLKAAPQTGAETLTLEVELMVRALRDGWSTVLLPEWEKSVMLQSFNGAGAVMKPTEQPGARHLAVRGKGRHVVKLVFEVPVARDNAELKTKLPFFGKPWTLMVAPDEGVVIGNPMVKADDGSLRVVIDDAAHGEKSAATLTWREGWMVADAESEVITNSKAVAEVSATEVMTRVQTLFRVKGWSPPEVLVFDLPDAKAQVLEVTAKGNQEVSWVQKDGVVEVRQSGGNHAEGRAGLNFVLNKALPMEATGEMRLVMDVPRLRGALRHGVSVALAMKDGVESSGWWDTTDGSLFEPEKENQKWLEGAPTPTGKGIRYSVAPVLVEARVRRLQDRFSTDVDLLVKVGQHEVDLTRTLTFHGEEGSVGRALLTLPKGEQFLGLETACELLPQWKRVGDKAVEINWPKTLTRGAKSVFALRTRRELPDLKAAGGAGLELSNVVVEGAARVAGYVAVDFDEGWRVTPQETRGLEERDGRSTPVKGRMAWFNLREFALTLGLARHEPLLDAILVTYALPKARVVELEGQMTVEVSRAPLRTVGVKLPVEVAGLMRWDSPLIGERRLDEKSGVWTLTLRKELLGVANLRFHLSLPAALSGRVEDEAKKDGTGTLEAVLPRIEVPAARRFAGTWVVEANTDTELAFETKGLQVMDATKALPVEGYAPRHRVLAAYGFTAAESHLKLKATRHAGTRLTSAVVERLLLRSVAGLDGTVRHEALLKVKHSGDQFFAMRLPPKAALLSAMVEGGLVKPVAAGDGDLKLSLPSRKEGGNTEVRLRVVYETRGREWGTRGKEDLLAPEFGAGVPVLQSRWRVHVPAGFSYGIPQSALTWMNEIGSGWRWSEGWQDEEQHEGDDPWMAELAAMGSSPTNYEKYVPLERVNDGEESIQAKMKHIIFPSVQFRNASLEEALEFLRIKSRDFDTEERDPALKGLKFDVENASKGNAARITLDLKEVPADEALRYITELAGVGYHVEGEAIKVLPKEQIDQKIKMRTWVGVPRQGMFAGVHGDGVMSVLSDLGITFGAKGLWASFDAEAGRLTMTHHQAQLDVVENVLRSLNAQQALLQRQQVPHDDAPYASTMDDSAYYSSKMRNIVLPELELEGASIGEAIEILRLKAKDLDTEERDPSRKGVNFVIKPGAETSTAQISLDLKNVPMDEALRYVTELGNLKYRVEKFAVVIEPLSEVGDEMATGTFLVTPDFAVSGDPKTALSQAGITFPEGASVIYLPTTSQLVVRNTKPNLDALEAYFGSMRVVRKYGQPLKQSGKTGLLPVELDLPVAGRRLEFEGAMKPGGISFSYVSWGRQMVMVCGGMILGASLLLSWGWRRPWWRSLWAGLLLVCVPLLLAPSVQGFCLAVLVGWLGAAIARVLVRAASRLDVLNRSAEAGSLIAKEELV